MAVSEVQRLLAMAGDKDAASGNMNPLLKRGAALHADVVFFAPPELSATSLSAASSILIQDGRQIGFDNSGIHWEFARALLDLAHPSPASDAEVRRWYAATGALMRRQLSHAHSGPHLERATTLFPGDPDFQFLAGCLHEALASLRIQSFLRSSGRRPPGVSSSANELATAERSFRRAVELAPEWAEARLRLGRVLDLRERHEDAIGELTSALHDADDPTLRYFGGLFLGDAEQALGRREPAQAAYEQALALFPGAQSPHLALAQLARRFADRPAALAAIDRMFARPVQSYQSLDPWWHYDAGTVGSDEEVRLAVVDAFADEQRP